MLGTLAIDPGGHGLGPGLAVGIGQGKPSMHLGDIRLGMKRIAFLKGPAESRRQLLRDGRLARSRHPHDDQYGRAVRVRALSLEAMNARCIGRENRIRPTDEEAALDYSDDAPNALLEPRRIGNRAKAAVENPVAAVRHKRLARCRKAQTRVGTKCFERRLVP